MDRHSTFQKDVAFGRPSFFFSLLLHYVERRNFKQVVPNLRFILYYCVVTRLAALMNQLKGTVRQI